MEDGEVGGESEKMSERELVGGDAEGALEGGVEEGFDGVIIIAGFANAVLFGLELLIGGGVERWMGVNGG